MSNISCRQKAEMGLQKKSEQRSMWQVPRCHPVQDYHTVIPFQHKRSTKQAKHETKNKQKATKIQKLKH
jgi:hypothetical protein